MDRKDRRHNFRGLLIRCVVWMPIGPLELYNRMVQVFVYWVRDSITSTPFTWIRFRTLVTSTRFSFVTEWRFHVRPLKPVVCLYNVWFILVWEEHNPITSVLLRVTSLVVKNEPLSAKGGHGLTWVNHNPWWLFQLKVHCKRLGTLNLNTKFPTWAISDTDLAEF